LPYWEPCLVMSVRNAKVLLGHKREMQTIVFLENISAFNDWHNNSNIECTRYTDPRFYDFERGACKECKIQCIPTEDSCPGVTELEAGFWNRTGKKLTTQYIERAERMAAERALTRRTNQFAKEQAKLEKIKNKMAEKKAKEENKQQKQENWEEWRENRRQENEAKRAQKKQEKKDRKAAAKAAKELRKVCTLIYLDTQ